MQNKMLEKFDNLKSHLV